MASEGDSEGGRDGESEGGRDGERGGEREGEGERGRGRGRGRGGERDAWMLVGAQLLGENSEKRAVCSLFALLFILPFELARADAIAKISMRNPVLKL